MFRFRWFANLLGKTHSRKDRRPSAQPHRRVCLTLEQLEDRVTPSTSPFNPGPLSDQALFMAIETQVIKQIPFMSFWNNQLQQTQGSGLPGWSNLVSLLQTQFPALTNSLWNGQRF
jgi:hypothetical protein